MYFLCNLRKYTKYDIIYAYSEVDTPLAFLNTIKNMKLGIKFYKYNDNGITINIKKKFKSVYTNFNTLRTCNFMYAYLLTQYKKVCLLESDMYVLKNIDDIFNLKTPSVHNSTYVKYLFTKEHNYTSNYEIINDPDVDYKTTKSPINGGVMLLKPSKTQFNKCLEMMSHIITREYDFPNETLFVLTNKKYYNLPIKYNFTHHFLEHGYYKFKDIRLIHYNFSTFKILDTTKENYYKYNKDKKLKRYLAKKYYKDVYRKCKDNIISLLRILDNNKHK